MNAHVAKTATLPIAVPSSVTVERVTKRLVNGEEIIFCGLFELGFGGWRGDLESRPDARRDRPGGGDERVDGDW